MKYVPAVRMTPDLALVRPFFEHPRLRDRC